MNATPTPDRAAFRLAVADVAAKAHAKLPACQGRIDAAVKLVLLGEVTLLPDGTAQVGSCTDPAKTYNVNGTCTCRDYVQAPGNLCKHRLAYGIARRAMEMLPKALPAPAPGPPPALPEAPASVNVHLMIAGRQVQLTLRDSDESRLLQRLAVVLEQYPVPAPPASPPSAVGKEWCSIHQTSMKQTTKDGRSWYSHRVDGRWCKGR
jgi:hypothetical protein